MSLVAATAAPSAQGTLTNTTASTVVVRLRRRNGRIEQDCDVYIGRRCTLGGWDLPESKWANPFVATRLAGDRNVNVARARAVQCYRQWIGTQPTLLAALEELRGKRLGCWCKARGDEPCHGDVLVELLRASSNNNKSTGKRDAPLTDMDARKRQTLASSSSSSK